jgi:hypothetical protein
MNVNHFQIPLSSLLGCNRYISQMYPASYTSASTERVIDLHSSAWSRENVQTDVLSQISLAQLSGA